MLKWIGCLAIGIVVGAGAVLLFRPVGSESAPAAPSAPGPAAPRFEVQEIPDDTDSRVGPRTLAEIQSLSTEFERTAALYELLRYAHADTIGDLLDEADNLDPDPAQRSKGVIYARYAELDPVAAARRIHANGVPESGFLDDVLATWAGVDLDAALAYVDTLEPESRRNAASVILRAREDLSRDAQREIAHRFSLQEQLEHLQVAALADTDPAAAWQAAVATEAYGMHSPKLWDIADIWLGKDPDGLFDAIGSLVNNRMRTTLQQSMMSRWAMQDYDTALGWVLARPPSRERSNLLAAVAQASAGHSPDEMLDLARALDGKERRAIVVAVVNSVARTDPQGALGILDEFDDPQMMNAASTALWQWAQSDAAAAFEWARAQNPSPQRSSLIATTLAAMVPTAPEHALALADDLEDGASRTAVSSILMHWANLDPQAATAWLDTSPYREPRMVSVMVSSYARQDPEAAFDWIMSQSVEVQRTAVASVVATASDESLSMAQRLVDRIRDPESKRSATRMLVMQWVHTSPPDAVRYLGRLDDGQSVSLYKAVFARWSQFDRAEATAFLRQLPASARDAATVGMIEQALYQTRDVAYAERMYDRLVGDDARRRAAVHLYRQLQQTAPERAKRYAEEASRPTDLSASR